MKYTPIAAALGRFGDVVFHHIGRGCPRSAEPTRGCEQAGAGRRIHGS